jgi:hypothetical protein
MESKRWLDMAPSVGSNARAPTIQEIALNAARQLPPAVQQALERGDLMAAIKLLRTSGIGMKEAKDAIEAHMGRGSKSAPVVAPPMTPGAHGADWQGHAQNPLDGLSPGQVPPSSEAAWWIVLFGLVAAAGYFWLRGG